MEQVCSNVCSSVGGCVQKDGTGFLCDISDLGHAVLGTGAWHTRGVLWQGAQREEGGKGALVTSFSSFTRITNCFRKVKRCLFIHPSYSFSGRDPRMLRWEGRKLWNPWHGSFPAQGWEACITHPDTDIYLLLLLMLQKAQSSEPRITSASGSLPLSASALPGKMKLPCSCCHSAWGSVSLLGQPANKPSSESTGWKPGLLASSAMSGSCAGWARHLLVLASCGVSPQPLSCSHSAAPGWLC